MDILFKFVHWKSVNQANWYILFGWYEWVALFHGIVGTNVIRISYSIYLRCGGQRSHLESQEIKLVRNSHFAERNGIYTEFSTVNWPTGNSFAERAIGVLRDKLTTLMDQQKRDWKNQLPFVVFTMNAQIDKTTLMSAYGRAFGREPNMKFDNLLPKLENLNGTQRVAFL